MFFHGAEVGFERDERAVEQAFVEAPNERLRAFLEPCETHSGKRLANGGRDRRQEIGGDRRNHADTECSREWIGRAFGRPLEFVGIREESECALDEFAANRRHEDTLLAPFEDSYAEGFLDLRELAAERRLGDATT